MSDMLPAVVRQADIFPKNAASLSNKESTFGNVVVSRYPMGTTFFRRRRTHTQLLYLDKRTVLLAERRDYSRHGDQNEAPQTCTSHVFFNNTSRRHGGRTG